MAAPHVAGVISLMLARNPFLTPAQVLAILQSTATAFPSNSNYCYNTGICGAGIVNAQAALNATPKRTFFDVPTNYWAWNFVERLSSAGITGGCATGPVRYCPETTVNSWVTPRCVTGMPAMPGTATGEVRPGITVTGTPASRQAITSS